MTSHRLDRSNTCVLLVDFQERLAPAMWNFAPVEKYARALALGARALELPVIASEQYPKGLGPTLSPLREALPSAPIAKTHFSCLGELELAKALDATRRKQVLIAGVETHVCVLQTVRDLLEQGYAPFVCADAVTSRFEEHRRLGLEQMRDMGAVITSAETALFDLLQGAGTPEFKGISALIR